jgi:dihydroorotate dehydrogenase
MTSLPLPLYDISKTFEENFRNPPFSAIIPSLPLRKNSAQADRISFLGHTLISRIGVAPCAVTTGKGIALLAKLGFDILTYKTIRKQIHPSYPLPNIVYVDNSKILAETDLTKPIYVQSQTHDFRAEKVAISNSFGNACLEPEVLHQDIALAKSALTQGQVLIVSIYGEGSSCEEMITEFSEAAQLAKKAGADILELNLSCPNLLKKDRSFFCDADTIKQLVSGINKHIRDLPLLVKLGLLPQEVSLQAILQAIAQAGAQGVSAINSVSMRVLEQTTQAAFGERMFSGVSGYPIRSLALQFIKKIAQINREQKLGLAIIGMGGITLPQHFNEFFDEGADIALSATGMMWNPHLALQYHQLM